ncbi:glutamyl-Q tRNA(Asp) ligase [Moraxella macacae 0408225]|uniref:Glutamyl-Q tRNA(Asp) ligase n=1 Tax=Moraxella macacae 0408225 TaxID=1230338 RepID=L2F9U9_9GAMM|nr:tRNA glutamyl-Q(34) synthetase GluQRS [Moraxella macacae]ELA09536.1 glutamyl-Q tRNA(Asp) ligase [Moraxella macacae 0408225]
MLAKAQAIAQAITLDSDTKIGRFAPSPTGNLHFGSLITAVASFCLAKKEGGKWLLRIEDVDDERCHDGFSQQILTDLTRLGLHWDNEVYYQSQHLDLYHETLENQLNSMSYGCNCSRKSIQQFYQKQRLLPNTPSAQNPLIYPKICQHKNLAKHHAVRLIMPDKNIQFFDNYQGIMIDNPQRSQGDIVVRRRQESLKCPLQKTAPKGRINYMLAVVIDDITQGVNQIVRGLDILPLTTAQLAIYDYLQAPRVNSYYHLPILVNHKGQKLSKQTLAEPIANYRSQDLLQLALQFLGQKPVEKNLPEIMLQQAITQWQDHTLVGKQQLFCPPLANLI